MQVKAHIDRIFKEIEIHVCNYERTPTVDNLVEEIGKFVNDTVVGTDKRGKKVVLSLGKMIRFYAENQKVFAQDENGLYSIGKKLYELENDLDEKRFLRISKSEIINLRKIERLDMSITGTIKVILIDGTQTFTSRRNVTKLKKSLGIT